MVDKYGVTLFYTAPTAIRTLMACGDAFVTKHSRKSIRILGTVGEPINPEAWRWYYEVGGRYCGWYCRAGEWYCGAGGVVLCVL